MSKLKFPHASGNSMSIGAPATNPASDLELKLPNSVGTGKINHSNFLEQISSPCDGSSITVPSGTYTIEDKDDVQTLTTSFADVVGSSISYTPPAGATQVIYEYLFSGIYQSSSDGTNPVMHIKFLIDSDEVTDARMTYAGQYNVDLFSFKWTINIGGSAVTATGRQATWTSSKTLKCQARDLSNNDAELNELRWWDGSTGDTFHRPQISITALGVPT